MLSSVQVAATRRFAEEKAPAPTFHSGQSSQLADSLRLPRATDYISITLVGHLGSYRVPKSVSIISTVS